MPPSGPCGPCFRQTAFGARKKGCGIGGPCGLGAVVRRVCAGRRGREAGRHEGPARRGDAQVARPGMGSAGRCSPFAQSARIGVWSAKATPEQPAVRAAVEGRERAGPGTHRAGPGGWRWASPAAVALSGSSRAGGAGRKGEPPADRGPFGQKRRFRGPPADGAGRRDAPATDPQGRAGKPRTGDMGGPVRRVPGRARGPDVPASASRARRCRSGQSICLKWNSPPSFRPDGQREVTVLVRV